MRVVMLGLLLVAGCAPFVEIGLRRTRALSRTHIVGYSLVCAAADEQFVLFQRLGGESVADEMLESPAAVNLHDGQGWQRCVHGVVQSS